MAGHNRNTRHPPGPRTPSPLQLLAYGRDVVSFLTKNRERFGPIFRMRFPLQPDLIVVSDADALEQLLQIDSDQIPPYPANHAIKSIFGPDSLLFKSGEPHRDDRSLLTPHFSSEAAIAAREMIREQVALHLQHVPLARLKIYPWAYRLTLRLTLIMFWGCQELDLIERIEHAVELSRQRYDSYRNMVLDTVAMSSEQYPISSRLLRLLPGDPRARLRQQFTGLINEQATKMRQSPDSYPECPFKTLLSRVPADAPVDDAFVDFMMTVLIAAYDPPAATTSWLLLELARSNEIQQQIQDEQLTVGSPTDSEALEASIQEVYRLYPPLHSITRTLTAPAEIGGFQLRAGTYVLPSIYLLHREPMYWDAPDEFRPERFLNRQRALDLSDGYLPFGASTRTCPGRHFATVITRTIASEFVNRYRMTSLQDQLKPPRTLGPTLVPDDQMAIGLEPRCDS